MNTSIRTLLALVTFGGPAVGGPAVAQDAPFLYTPHSLLNRQGDQKGMRADESQPMSSSRYDSFVHSDDSTGQRSPQVVRFYVLNVVTNVGQQKPEMAPSAIAANQGADFESDLFAADVFDTDVFGTETEVGAAETHAFDSGFAMVDTFPDVDRNSGTLRPVSGQELPFRLNVAAADEVFEPPVPLDPVPDRVLLPHASSAEPDDRLSSGQPAQQFDAPPVAIPVPNATDTADVADQEPSRQERTRQNQTGEAGTGPRSVLRPEFSSPLSSIQLASVIPRTKGDSSAMPDNRALSLSGGWGQIMDGTPAASPYYPRRNVYPVHHNPLYFEDPNLERCGQTNGCLTDVASIMHFAGRVPILPYLMTVNHPRSCVRAKPDCPTCHEFALDAYIPHPDELDLGGAAVQAAATVGLIFLIP
ncbi:MAG: hypothetical protein R3C59_17555 [Planctomycetaceae bacterium]